MCVMASERVSSGGFVGNRTEIAFVFHRATVSPLLWPVLWGAEDGAAKAAPTSTVTAASPRLANTTVRAVFPLPPLPLPIGARPDTLRFLIIFIVLPFVLFVVCVVCFCWLLRKGGRAARLVQSSFRIVTVALPSSIVAPTAFESCTEKVS